MHGVLLAHTHTHAHKLEYPTLLHYLYLPFNASELALADVPS